MTYRRAAGYDCPGARGRGAPAQLGSSLPRERNTENELAKQLVYGLLAITFAGPALAGGRYVEVWNPPEARGATAVHKKKATLSAHESAKRRHASLYVAAPHVHREPGAAIPARTSVHAPAHATSTPAASAAPTFDDLPRQLTPEGNVLRVKGSHGRIDVER